MAAFALFALINYLQIETMQISQHANTVFGGHNILAWSSGLLKQIHDFKHMAIHSVYR
jgi:hypothetical protein